MQLAKRQTLSVARIKDFGVYLEDIDSLTGEAVLLPRKEVPENVSVDDKIEVFLYKDSSDRLIATTKTPYIALGEIAPIKVKDVCKIGAFLDIGLDKDILLPFKEMEENVSVGDEILVSLYIDRTDRLALTMKIYSYLQTNIDYKKDDIVKARVYAKKPFGVLVAIDDKYYGLIPKSEVYTNYRIGEVLDVRVMKVREDGKLDVSPRQKSYLQLNDDAIMIYDKLIQAGGEFNFDDKASPDFIKREFNLSKNSFKKAVGNLLKKGDIILKDGHIIDNK